ncbi:SDR family NAD(P)-dependent oxidoreductase [Amycolatopsis samaneae]|uniref:SDR family NAD(P)-dependent oxidoreductase n=1 Tax=Amycolatopsis samaneae TaxID=664691 RepID=A0ABW5GXR3_9PSEU
MTSQVWFVTGAGRGFGRLVTERALAAGHRVVGTARNPAALEDLLARHGDALVALPLDVTDRAAVFAAVETAAKAFGRIDVVLNNAGQGLMGAVEELTEAAVRELMDVNFFGALWVTQAVTPVLRTQKSGRLLQMSSVGGVLGVPTMGAYAASKWALEGLSEALAGELAPFGVHVTLVEPRTYATGFLRQSMKIAEPRPEYRPVRAALARAYAGDRPGDPARVAEALLALAAVAEPPLRVLLGDGDYDVVLDAYRKRVEEWERWERISRDAG